MGPVHGDKNNDDNDNVSPIGRFAFSAAWILARDHVTGCCIARLQWGWHICGVGVTFVLAWLCLVESGVALIGGDHTPKLLSRFKWHAL